MLINQTPGTQTRLWFFGGLIVLAMLHLLYRLYEVQVSRGEVYVNRLRDQTTVAVRLSPARGAIVDTNGLALAENRASFDVDFYLDELVRTYSRQHRGNVPRLTTTKTGKSGKVYTETSPDIVKIVNDSMEPIAKNLGFENRPDTADLRQHYRIRRDIPFQYRTDVDFTTLAQFSERNLGVPGIDIAARPVRQYPYGALAAHILGYVGKPESSEQTTEDGYEFETVGKEGIEKTMDSHLQGKPGGRILRVNYRGYIDREEGFTPPSVGNTVYLTIDARIQHIVEECMRDVGRGAAVVIDPNNGDVLALASVPNFDPNDFIPKIQSAKWKALNTDPTAPLINRTLSAYAPGSTFKVPVALAALKSKAITPQTVIHSPGFIMIGNRAFKDWNPNGQGSITVHDALRMSCNTFFYQIGMKAGIDALVSMGQLGGFGQLTGIPISGESPGIMPGPEWLKKRYPKERWTNATTANVSIGQGFLEVTPLQMTLFMGAVANGGTLYYPRLIKSVTDLNGDQKVSVPTRPRSELGIKFSDMAAVRQALLAVVENGTGRRVGGIPGIQVAGKTGSAQFSKVINGVRKKDTRAWFFGFAPFENPRYAFCVMVEGGVAGGSTAGPIVHNILQRVFAMEQGEIVNMTALPPAIGHFRGVQDIAPDQPHAPAAPATPPADSEPTVLPEDNDPPPIMQRRRL
jgi:penicillin-binding protein 2